MVGQRSIVRGIVFLVIIQGLAGCGSSGSSAAPSALSPVPQPVPQPTPIRLAAFTDPAAGFSTPDVRDAQEQIVRFNTADELIWTADDTRFPGFPVSGNVVTADKVCRFCTFQVRFGTKDGERRAYLTWTDETGHFEGHPPTIFDIEVVSGQLVITGTNVPVPGT